MINITDDNHTRVYKRKEPIFGGMLSFIVSFLWGLQGVVITEIDEPRPLADWGLGWVELGSNFQLKTFFCFM